MFEQHHRKKKRSPLQKGCGFAPSMSASFSVTKACKAECKALRQLGASNAGEETRKIQAVFGTALHDIWENEKQTTISCPKVLI